MWPACVVCVTLTVGVSLKSEISIASHAQDLDFYIPGLPQVARRNFQQADTFDDLTHVLECLGQATYDKKSKRSV